MDEAWKPVVGYESDYSISNHGRVKRTVPHGPNKKSGGFMCQVIGKRGYPVVQLWSNKSRAIRTVHQLVAEAFIGPRVVGMEVDHVDGNKLNNHLSNLEYVTKRENLLRKIPQGLQQYGERVGTSKLRTHQIEEILNLQARGMSYSKIGEVYGVGVTQVWRIVHGKAWKRAQATVNHIR